MRAYYGDEKQAAMLSSGLEDYFLGTYYFECGRYANDLAGLTHLDPNTCTFSGYRIHDRDPFFSRMDSGLRVVAGKKLATIHLAAQKMVSIPPMSGSINGNNKLLLL